MPVHINEIVIRASWAAKNERRTRQRSEEPSLDRREIIVDCVEQVMALLEDRLER